METLLLSNLHVICCIRAREKTSFKNPSKPEPMGIQPICEKSFMFEMTCSCMMNDDAGATRQILKNPPPELQKYWPSTGYLGIEQGKAFRYWLNGEGGDDMEPIRNKMRLAASNGCDSLQQAWVALANADKKALGVSFKDVLKAQAVAVDNSRIVGKESATIEPEPANYQDAIISRCQPGNPYGISAAQAAKSFGVAFLNEISDERAKEIYDNWLDAVEMITNEEE